MKRMMIVFVCILCGLAAYAAVEETVWKALVNENVIIEKNDGSEVAGKLQSVDDQNAVVVKADGKVVTVAKRDVLDIRVNKAGATAGQAAGTPRPLGMFSAAFNPLGFLQVGPIIDLEVRAIEDLVIIAHFRWHGGGALSYVINNALGSQLQANSFAFGAGARYLFPLASTPNRAYVGILGESLRVNFRDDVGETWETEGYNQMFVVMANGGYRWRFDSGLFVNLGAYFGIANTSSGEWHQISDPTITGTPDLVTVAMGMLELCVGWEF